MAKEITGEDLLTSFDEFETKNKITEDRHDLPHRFLGICPSKYYKSVDMNTGKLGAIVDNMFQKFLLRNPQ
jgi:hypothetical protein